MARAGSASAASNPLILSSDFRFTCPPHRSDHRKIYRRKFIGFTIAGPWLYRAFKLHDIPNQLWISLTDYLFEWLAGVIIDLTGKINNFYVISSTKGTLVRAKLDENGPSGVWWTPSSRQKSSKFKLRVHIQQKTCCALPGWAASFSGDGANTGSARRPNLSMILAPPPCPVM